MLTYQGVLELTLNTFLTYGLFKTRQGKILSVLLGFYKASSLLIRRIGQPSMLLPCYLCFKSSTGAIVENGQVAVEVIITQNFSFPFPPFALLWWINRPVCTHNITRPFCTIEYESIHTHTPPTADFFPPPILIPRMSLHIYRKTNRSREFDSAAMRSAHWFPDGGCWLLYTGEMRVRCAEGCCSAYPNCCILLRNLTWLFLKCSVNPAPPIPTPTTPPSPTNNPPPPPWGYGASAKFVLQCVVTLQWQCSNIPLLFQNKLPAVSH